uniref:C2H2-type domain-containing protein n=1 Tax=Trichogramma kaykai TaxID=54128 RepID=A0ABD2X3B1_9HYME
MAHGNCRYYLSQATHTYITYGCAHGNLGSKQRLKNIIHDGNKPFDCEICHKSFGLNTSLQRHIKAVHDRSKPFQCDICHKSFGYKGDLNKHISSVHDRIKPFDTYSSSSSSLSDVHKHYSNAARTRHVRDRLWPNERCALYISRFINELLKLSLSLSPSLCPSRASGEMHARMVSIACDCTRRGKAADTPSTRYTHTPQHIPLLLLRMKTCCVRPLNAMNDCTSGPRGSRRHLSRTKLKTSRLINIHARRFEQVIKRRVSRRRSRTSSFGNTSRYTGHACINARESKYG